MTGSSQRGHPTRHHGRRRDGLPGKVRVLCACYPVPDRGFCCRWDQPRDRRNPVGTRTGRSKYLRRLDTTEKLVAGERQQRFNGGSEELVGKDQAFQTSKMIDCEDDYVLGHLLLTVEMDRRLEKLLQATQKCCIFWPVVPGEVLSEPRNRKGSYD